jgi:hypothetical protein
MSSGSLNARSVFVDAVEANQTSGQNMVNNAKTALAGFTETMDLNATFDASTGEWVPAANGFTEVYIGVRLLAFTGGTNALQTSVFEQIGAGTPTEISIGGYRAPPNAGTNRVVGPAAFSAVAGRKYKFHVFHNDGADRMTDPGAGNTYIVLRQYRD